MASVYSHSCVWVKLTNGEGAEMTLRDRMGKAMHAFDESIGEVPCDWPEAWDHLPHDVRAIYGNRADAILALQGSDFLIVTEQQVKTAFKATMNKWLDGCSDDEWNHEADDVWNDLLDDSKT